MEDQLIIRIVYYSETIDNMGRTESSAKGHNIFSVLNNTEEWSDDMEFYDDKGQKYFIDDLIGKEVWVEDIGIFTVEE
jgi:hypothetical protein